MPITKYYQNKDNENKCLEVRTDGHYHNFVRQFIKGFGGAKVYTGDGKFRRWKKESLEELLNDYTEVNIMYTLIETLDREVLYSKEYSNLEEAKEDLDAEFYSSTVDDNSLEYGKDCFQSKDGKKAWVIKDGKCRIWEIAELMIKKVD